VCSSASESDDAGETCSDQEHGGGFGHCWRWRGILIDDGHGRGPAVGVGKCLDATGGVEVDVDDGGETIGVVGQDRIKVAVEKAQAEAAA